MLIFVVMCAALRALSGGEEVFEGGGGEGELEGGAHGDADGFAVEGVGGSCGEEDASGAEGEGGAEDAADVVVVGEAAAVDVEADDGVHDGLGGDVDGGFARERVEGVGDLVVGGVVEEDAFDGETGGSGEGGEDESALGHEGAAIADKIGVPHVAIGCDARVVQVVDAISRMITPRALVCTSLVAVLALSGCGESGEPAASESASAGGDLPSPFDVEPQGTLPGSDPEAQRRAAERAQAARVQAESDAGESLAGMDSFRAGGVSFEIPEGWTARMPSSSMRAAELVIPAGESGGEAGVLAVFAGIMGTVDQNINRWIGQVRDPESPAVRESREVGGLTVHTVVVTGTYDAGMMAGGTGPQAGTTLLGDGAEGGARGEPRGVAGVDRQRVGGGLRAVGERALNKYDLYELCVQSPEMSARFVDALLGGKPATIGEEFCGPASIAREYVALGGSRHAIATDADPEPIAHARVRAGEDLGEAERERLSFCVRDVREEASPVRALVAMNFALCELTDRAGLVEYLGHAHSRLTEGGVYVADLYGGEHAFATGVAEVVFETGAGDVVYEWKQVAASPLTGRVRNEIDFTLPGGEKLERAFVYDWRLWSPAELADAFREAGFSRVEFHAGYGGAVDEDGAPMPEAVGEDDELGDEWVIFVVDKRLRTGAALAWTDARGQERVVLIDTTPDLRQQALREGFERCDAILYTHNHVDHIFGLDEVRRFNAVMRAPIDIYAEDYVLDSLKRVYKHVFDKAANVNDSFVATLIAHEMRPERSFELFGLRVTPLRFLHGRLPILGFRFDRADGVDDPNFPLAYGTDVSAIPTETWPELEGVKTLVLDALRERHHPTHFNLDQALSAAARIGPERAWFIHIGHEMKHAEISER
ncbi:lipB, partial [Symbiodinium necroappetens]